MPAVYEIGGKQRFFQEVPQDRGTEIENAEELPDGQKYSSYKELIERVWLPVAIRYKIPYETFWSLNPRIMRIYQDAYIQNKKEEYKFADYRAWLNGAYILRSVQAALSPKKIKYFEKPLEQEEQETLSEQEKFLLWVEAFNQRFEEKGENECQK